MRVLYLTDVAAPRVNGVSTSIAVFRRELERVGVATPLLAPRYGDEADEPGVTRLRGRPVPFDPEDRYVPARRFVAASYNAIVRNYNVVKARGRQWWLRAQVEF